MSRGLAMNTHNFQLRGCRAIDKSAISAYDPGRTHANPQGVTDRPRRACETQAWRSTPTCPRMRCHFTPRVLPSPPPGPLRSSISETLSSACPPPDRMSTFTMPVWRLHLQGARPDSGDERPEPGEALLVVVQARRGREVPELATRALRRAR